MRARDADLRTELLGLFDGGAAGPLPDAEFNALAMRVFAHNVETVPAYAGYVRARGRGPESIGHWTEIPAVPTAAFKELALRDGTCDVERVFRTSGTTRGPERRGEHHVCDLGLYRASLRATFEAYVLPAGERLRTFSLMPPAPSLPDSSLAYMIGDVLHAFGADGSDVFADADGLDYAGIDGAVAAAAEEGEPVMLLGTSSAFTRWLDHLSDAGRSFVLPVGSRLMDTGGYKGHGRRLDPTELREAYRERLALPAWACVNEYGMTELLSQYYDAGLRDRMSSDREPAGDRVKQAAGSDALKRGPGWLRSVAVDPETLDPLPAGETGLLRHVDLANLHSVAAVQTEDLGRLEDDGLVVEGRVAGATPRGCSIAMDLLLEETS